MNELLNQFINQLRLTYRLMRDGRVSLFTKAVPIFVAIYVISPIDLIPFVPIDDIAVMLGGMRVFEMLVPEYIVAEHKAALGMELR